MSKIHIVGFIALTAITLCISSVDVVAQNTGAPSVQRSTLPNGQIELKITGTSEQVDQIVDYIANDDELRGADPTVNTLSLALKGGWLSKRWNRLTQDVRNGINKVVPMYSYCAEYRENADPTTPYHRATVGSRLGADSVKIRFDLQYGDANVRSVTRGPCR